MIELVLKVLDVALVFYYIWLAFSAERTAGADLDL